MPTALARLDALLEPSARGAAMSDGYLDVLGADGPPSTGRTQDLMLGRLVPAVYERFWRPAWGRIATGVGGPTMADELRIARELLALGTGDGVLDVACGPGNFTRDFGRAVGPDGLAVGFDASATMLARAVRDTPATPFPGVAYVRGDALALPFRDKSFDAVCCFLALHLFADPYGAVREMERVLTPGGRIAFFTTSRLRSFPLGITSQFALRRAGMYVFRSGELERTLRARGLRDVTVTTTGLTQYVGARKPTGERRRGGRKLAGGRRESDG